MRIISFNVNGIRAITKKGFFDWVRDCSPDILCLQETKAHPKQLTDELLHPLDYKTYWSSAEKPGYSGEAVLTKTAPKQVTEGLGKREFDSEGRTLILDYGIFVLLNLYVPNGGSGNKRVPFKLAYYDELLKKLNQLKKYGKKLVLCGDINTAHTEIDLAHPKENESRTGFLPEERAWITKLINNGYLDTFRQFHKEGKHYTWWDYKTKARDRDIGWRIDYFFLSGNLRDRLTNSFIMKNVYGSDHCPIGIELKFE